MLATNPSLFVSMVRGSNSSKVGSILGYHSAAILARAIAQLFSGFLSSCLRACGFVMTLIGPFTIV